MILPVRWRTLFAAGSVAVLASFPGSPAAAGDAASGVAEAEALLSEGKPGEALAAMDKAAAAFWVASPLTLRVATFADKVAGFANYEPRAEAKYREGDTLTVYFEPFGFGFMPDGDGFKSALAADVEIRTPGGLVLGKAADFARLEWSGRTKMHEVHATIAMPLPPLKPGEYQLLITLRDQASPKTATIDLPFTVEK